MDSLDVTAVFLAGITLFNAAIAGYFTYRAKQRETEANIRIATIQNRDDDIAANTARQQSAHVYVQDGLAYLTKRATNQIKEQEQDRQAAEKARAEMDLIRIELNKANQRIQELEKLPKRIKHLETELAATKKELEQTKRDLKNARARESTMRERISRIKGELDTGPLEE